MLFPEIADQINGIFPEIYGNYQIPGVDRNSVNLYVLRHASTDLDDQDKSHGWIDSPLNMKGMSQATDMASKIKGIVPTRIISSDLTRAMQTASEISKQTGVQTEPDPRLRALNTGIYAGLKANLVHEQLKPFFKNMDMRIPGGETVREFHDRTIQSIQEALNGAKKGDKVVIMGHSTTPRLVKAWSDKKQLAPLSSDEIGGVNHKGDDPILTTFKFNPTNQQLQKK